jgi:hypothetical protein
MQASPGDQLRVRSHHIGEADREALVLECHGSNGAPPYLVRWTDGHESVFFPAADTLVEHPQTG